VPADVGDAGMEAERLRDVDPVPLVEAMATGLASIGSAAKSSTLNPSGS
jgi:hypothetical protein